MAAASGWGWAGFASQPPHPSACPLGTQANGLDFPKQPVPVGGAISTAQAQAFFGHLHQVGRASCATASGAGRQGRGRRGRGGRGGPGRARRGVLLNMELGTLA